MSEEEEYEPGDRVVCGRSHGTVLRRIEIDNRPCSGAECCPDYYHCPNLGVHYEIRLDGDSIVHVRPPEDFRLLDRRVDHVRDEGQSALLPE